MLPETMRAVEYKGPERVELRRVAVPQPKTGELLVRVRAATTCIEHAMPRTGIILPGFGYTCRAL